MKRALLAALAAASLVACGSTRVAPSDGGDYAIYVDGVYKGNGEAFVSTMGTHQGHIFEAKDGDQLVGKYAKSRHITASTLGLSLFTYFTAIYWGQNYTEDIVIPICIKKPDSTATKNSSAGWDAPINENVSKWEQPIK